MLPLSRRVLLLGSLCTLGANGCGRSTPGYVMTQESITWSRLNSLADRAEKAHPSTLRNVRSYDEFLALLFPPQQADETRYFIADGWGKPYVFERNVSPDGILLTISSSNQDPGTQRPLKLEIVIPSGDGPITTRRIWGDTATTHGR